MRLSRSVEIVADDIDETLSSYSTPAEHWRCLTKNPLERAVREMRRRTRKVGTLPDGQSVLMVGRRGRDI